MSATYKIFIVLVVINSIAIFSSFISYQSANESLHDGENSNFRVRASPGSPVPISKPKSKGAVSRPPTDSNQPNIAKYLMEPNVFALLGAYPEINNKRYDIRPKYNETHYGLRNDNDYCTKVDNYNLANPNNMFDTRNYFTDYAYHTLPRERVMAKHGRLVMPYLAKNMPTKDFNSRRYNLSLEITNFFNNFKGIMHNHHKIGEHFLCATQMYNHIPGSGHLVRKDSFLDILDIHAQKFQDQPHCFKKDDILLPFYRLYNEQECQDFFVKINSNEYKESLINEPIQYLIKIGRGSHMGDGVFLLDASQTKKLNTTYKNGAKCGEIKDSLIAQKYITNPLLLDMDNKFDFRIYGLIASTNPLIVYYHDGFLRVALNSFSKDSSDRATHLTNTHLADMKIQEAKKKKQLINNMTEKQLADYHLWSFERLEKYLLKSKKISDPNWLDNYLRPSIHKAMIHIMKAASERFLNHSNVYELHGMDFILDDDMKLWFIESNPNPLLTGTTKHMIYYETVRDAFNIMYSYYKSRMTRFLDVVKRMKNDPEAKSQNLAKWQEEFKQASKNKLEPQFKIPKSNTFKLILDESLPEKKAYMGYIPNDCYHAH